MSGSDTGETSRFKTKHIEPVTNIEDTTNSGDNSQNGDNQTLFTAAVEKADKHKKRKSKRKRELSPESSSSDSRNSSFSEESAKEGNSTKSHRFQIISKSQNHKWELPGEIADYVNYQFESFIPEKDVEENQSLRMSGASKGWTIL